MSNFVKRIRQIIQKYLTTENGVMEINHVINEIQKINDANDTSKNKTAAKIMPPIQMTTIRPVFIILKMKHSYILRHIWLS